MCGSGAPAGALLVKNLTSIYEDAVLIPGLTQWVKRSGDAVSCGVGGRHGSNLVLLWLWCRPAAAALIQPLAWELVYATGAALKRPKKKKMLWGQGVPIVAQQVKNLT